MKDVSYELKRTACDLNPFHLLSVTVLALSSAHWEGHSCAKSGSVYSSISMREGLIDALYEEGHLEIAKPEHSQGVDYECADGKLTIHVKYYNDAMKNAGDPQAIADGLYSTMENKMNGAVARHLEVFAAHQRHLIVAKRALTKEAGGDGK